MSQRTRRTNSLRPGTSELEKHQGVSALLFGSAAAALSPVDQPSFVDVAGGLAHRPTTSADSETAGRLLTSGHQPRSRT